MKIKKEDLKPEVLTTMVYGFAEWFKYEQDLRDDLKEENINPERLEWIKQEIEIAIHNREEIGNIIYK